MIAKLLHIFVCKFLFHSNLEENRRYLTNRIIIAVAYLCLIDWTVSFSSVPWRKCQTCQTCWEMSEWWARSKFIKVNVGNNTLLLLRFLQYNQWPRSLAPKRSEKKTQTWDREKRNECRKHCLQYSRSFSEMLI